LFRNNVGVLRDSRGNYVSYGLCSGSSDLIGWKPKVILPEMVGKTVAVFTAIEVKSPHGILSKEQEAFLNAVREAGGIGFEVRSINDLEEKMGHGKH